MTSILKNVYIDKLDEIANKYNNTRHRTIKMRSEFKVGSHVRTSKYKNIFAKGYVINWSEEVVIKELKTLCLGHMLIVILMEKKFLQRVNKNNCKKTNPKDFRTEKVIKRKGDKLFAKWKEYVKYRWNEYHNNLKYQ